MTEPRPTTERTKQFTVKAAVELLRRVGCIVVTRPNEHGYIIDVSIPPDTQDIHSRRLEYAREQTT